MAADARRLWKLSNRTSTENGTIVLFLAGRLGHATVRELKAALDAATGHRPTDLVVDLSGVDYLSSAAIKVFESVAAAHGRPMTFRSPSAAARLSLELAGLRDRTK